MRTFTRASRLLFGPVLAASLLAGAATSVLAQAGSGIDVDVPYVDDEGIARGTITLSKLDDPFADFEPSAPAPEGSRYVGSIVVFTAADDQQMDTYPFGVALVDAGGTIWSPGYVPRPADAIVPDAQNQRMAPGNRLSGFVGWIIPEDVVIDHVIYQPDAYRALLLADLVPAAGPAPGEPVEYADADSGAVADLSATVIDPFPDFDPSYPAAEGQRYVMVDAAFQAKGDRGYAANPYHVILHTADGHLVYASAIPRPYDAPRPLLESQTMSPGDRISGFVPFVVPAAAEIASVDYQPAGNRRVIIADVAGGGTPPPSTPEPAASVAPEPSAGTAQ